MLKITSPKTKELLNALLALAQMIWCSDTLHTVHLAIPQDDWRKTSQPTDRLQMVIVLMKLVHW